VVERTVGEEARGGYLDQAEKGRLGKGKKPLRWGEGFGTWARLADIWKMRKRKRKKETWS
jgi:hypothetical protein